MGNERRLLRLGVAKVDITPASPVPLAGFAVRSGLGAYEGISERLYARIFVWDGGGGENGGADPTGRLAVLVSADLLWWGSDRVPALKRRICERFGIPEDAILLHGTHTHSGPQTSGRFTSYLGVMDAEYVDALERRVLDGIAEACAGLEPVRVGQASGQSPLGINRRGIVQTPRDPGPVDHELRVIRFLREDGSTKGLLVHYACHPVITRDNRLSSEYAGVAMGIVERTVGGGAVAAFLQGTCGDINPGDGTQVVRGDHAAVTAVGEAFAECVLAALAGPLQEAAACPLAWRKMRIELPLAPLPARAALEVTALAQGVLGEWSAIMLERYETLLPVIPLEIMLLQLADGTALLGMNAEVVVAYGLWIKFITGGTVLPMGYTNGMFGYIPTARQLEEGGYETHESTLYFGMPASFDPAVEQVMKEGLRELLR
ncbi:neutral/alkaline non-lysosomal ceramidase N-terminal domain-containing protein [Paenibacillus ferrarius]|uniref:neutral/alkaline non-lysosomal ceramidase N-terminal domain-containing protein n=1 Tax=Paenibacillus ferrarius TaxID=1469647 RepID=UPI003D2669A7